MILMDYMMLEMNCLDYLKQLRSNPKTQAIPVFFLTAQATLSESLQFQAMGAVEVISKPFDALLLVPTIIQSLNWEEIHEK